MPAGRTAAVKVKHGFHVKREEIDVMSRPAAHKEIIDDPACLS